MDDKIQQTSSFINETPPDSGAFKQEVPTVPTDLGSGLSGGSDSVFSNEVPEAKEMSSYDGDIAEVDTLPFTQMASAYVTPTYGAELLSIVPDSAKQPVVAADGPDAYKKAFTRRQARPTMYQYGTNILMPLGAFKFNEYGSTIGSAIARGAWDAVIPSMNSLVPSLSTPGSYREVANWRRIFDLKNTVIGYFNRSIPFTDLSAADRFALEINYMRDVCACVMPIYARAAAISLVNYWQRMGYQFDNAVLTNLNDQTVERIIVQIYGAVAKLPSVDDVLMKRLTSYTKLHTTAKHSGYCPTIMMQDVSVGGVGDFAWTNVDAGSGYRVTTRPTAITNPSALNGTTFMEWLEIWLRSDLYSQGEAVEILTSYLALAQSIRTNYSILLACCQQLERYRSVSYSYIGEFLPIKRVLDLTVEYADVGPTFDYGYKERMEYAPRNTSAEYAAGSNVTFRLKLIDLPSSNSTSYTGNTITRPVGLYKGSKCWNARELTDIGLFKAASITGYIEFRDVLAATLGVTLTFNNASGALSTWEDAYYGDVYRQSLTHIAKIAPTATTGNVYRAHDPVITYYGVGDARNGVYANVSSYIADGGTLASCLSLVKGTQILSWADVDVNAAAGSRNLLKSVYYQLSSLFTQLDLTLYFGSTKNVSGDICEPIFYFTNYRGVEFDDIDATPVENALARAYHNLVLPLKAAAPKREVTATR